MKRTNWTVAICIAAIFGSVACSDDSKKALEPECAADTDCTSENVCRLGTCIHECDADSECHTPGKICVAYHCTASCVASPEVCDLKDNDCDGVTDNGVQNVCGGCGEVFPLAGMTCDTSQRGVCGVGTWTCTGTVEAICARNTAPTPEICNGLDDDCDNEADEGNTCECVAGATRGCLTG